MGEESPGSPATADGLGTSGNLNDAAMRDGTEGTAAADAAAEKEATTAAEEEARWAEPQPEEWREAAAGKRWRSRNAAPDGRVRVAIQAVGPWASVKELFRAIEQQQTRPIDWIFMNKRGSGLSSSYRTRLIDVDKPPMIRQGELAYGAQHIFVPHGDAKYRCDPSAVGLRPPRRATQIGRHTEGRVGGTWAS